MIGTRRCQTMKNFMMLYMRPITAKRTTLLASYSTTTMGLSTSLHKYQQGRNNDHMHHSNDVISLRRRLLGTHTLDQSNERRGYLSQIVFVIRCVGRTLYLLVNFTPLLVTFPLYFFTSSITSAWNNWLLRTLEQCGPTFIKLGQWVSTRPDLFPAHLTGSLSKLHDNVRPQSFQKLKETIEKELGKPIDEIFEWINEEAVGSGCVAQVHLAKLRNSSSDCVAVKVQRSGIELLIELDLAILRFFANTINCIPTMKWLSLPEEVEQFHILMNLQLDLKLEAQNLTQFQQNFTNTQKFHFPSPAYEYVSRRVLVEEAVEGIPMGKFLTSNCHSVRQIVAELGLDAFLKMMLLDNFIHADLHPGNIIVRIVRESPALSTKVAPASALLNADGTLNDDSLSKFIQQGYSPELVFLDAGLVTTLTDDNMMNFVDLFSAIADGNGKLVAKLMVERSRLPEPKCQDYEGFENKMQSIISHVQEKTFQLANIHIGDLLTQVFSLVRQHHVKIESDFTNLIVSIMVLEGLGRQLDPEIDLFEAARPLLRFRRKEFYTQSGGVFLKLSAFLEARFWLKKYHSEEYDIIDTLMFNNW